MINSQITQQEATSSGITQEDIVQEIHKLMAKRKEATPHSEILDKLLNQLEPLDFELLAFPELEQLRRELEDDATTKAQKDSIKKQIDSYKLTTKHFLIITVETIIELANRNKWGICKNHEFIYQYNGTFWSELDKEVFQAFLGEAAEQMGVAKFSARYYQFREQLFKQFLSEAHLPKPEQKSDKVLINLLNGTFEITTGNKGLRPFDRRDFITYQLPFEYDSRATATMFQKYLDRVLPDIQSQKVLAEYLGFVFIKNGSSVIKEEKALILYGTGANGKSVFFEIVTALLGSENVSNYSLQSLTEEKGFYRAKIQNKLVNYASEINGKLETSLFKALVSGEPVEACLKYGQPFTMTEYAKLIFNCNELPKDIEHSNAYFRRFLIIPFDVTIPDIEQDKSLHNKIISKELSGVFNWVLDGLDRLLKQRKFSECEAARIALDQYRLESNTVQMFLSENDFKKSANNYLLIKNVYPEYRSFCFEEGCIPFKKINFIRQLKTQGYVITRGAQNQLVLYAESCLNL